MKKISCTRLSGRVRLNSLILEIKVMLYFLQKALLCVIVFIKHESAF